MGLGKIEKFVFLSLFAQFAQGNRGTGVSDMSNSSTWAVGAVDRSQLIFSYYQIQQGEFEKNYKEIVKDGIPIHEYNKLQSTFSRALSRLKDKGFLKFNRASGMGYNRNKRRVGISITQEGAEQILALVSIARAKLGAPSARMTRSEIKSFLGL